MTDDTQALALGLRRRDPELLDRLIEQYQQRLYRYLLFLTAEPALAEDLFQETWVRVFERGHQYQASSRFESWLFAIARHLVIDVSRRKKLASLDELSEPGTHPRSSLLTTAPFRCCRHSSRAKTSKRFNSRC